MPSLCTQPGADDLVCFFFLGNQGNYASMHFEGSPYSSNNRSNVISAKRISIALANPSWDGEQGTIRRPCNTRRGRSAPLCSLAAPRKERGQCGIVLRRVVRDRLQRRGELQHFVEPPCLRLPEQLLGHAQRRP